MGTTTTRGTRAALILAALAVLDQVEAEGRDTGLGDAFSSLRDEVEAPSLPALTFEPGDCWETFADVLTNRLGGLVMQATPASQAYADAYFGGSVEPFDMVPLGSEAVDNTIDGTEAEYGITFRRFDEAAGDRVGPVERAPLSAFAGLHLY